MRNKSTGYRGGSGWLARETLLLTTDAEHEAEQRFYSPLVYSAAAFVDVFQQHHSW